MKHGGFTVAASTFYGRLGWETLVVWGYAILNNNPAIFDTGNEAIYVF